MRTTTRNRRAALDGLTRILDAGAPEELFTGSEEEALFLYGLLVETGKARESFYYWEICRTARRRRVTPEYVIDRATVLLAAMRERRRSDLYRILGVPPLATAEVVRQRWIEVAKRHHPDVGGDVAVFRHLKQAYDVLRDPARRTEYERFWVRALAPFERVAVGYDGGPAGVPALEEQAGASAPVMVEEVVPADAAVDSAALPEPGDFARDALHAAARLFAARNAFDRRLDAGGEQGGLSGLLARIDAVLAPLDLREIERLQADAAQAIAEFERLQATLATVASLKRALGA